MSAHADLRPWDGRAERADRILVAGLALSGIYALALLPLVPSLVGSHPLLLEILRGSSTSMITMGGLARTGQASLLVAVLAGLPAYMAFDWLYWWAGRRWGARALASLLGAPHQAQRRRARLERAMARSKGAAVVLAPFLPVPTALVYAAAGLGGMRLRTFLTLDLLGSLLWAGTLVALGYVLGHHAVAVAHAVTRYALWVTGALVVGIVVAQARGRRRGPPAEGPADQPEPQ